MKFFLIAIVIAIICIELAIATSMTFKQNDYTLTYERAEVVTYNLDYISKLIIKNFKYNRTQAASNINITFHRNISADAKIQIKAYKFMSNEYRDFPILFSYNFCEAINNDDFGMAKLFTCGNLTKHCPFVKGNYYICNFAPNEKNFPPFIPEGYYMVDLKWFDGPMELVYAQGYAKIKAKNTWELN